MVGTLFNSAGSSCHVTSTAKKKWAVAKKKSSGLEGESVRATQVEQRDMVQSPSTTAAGAVGDSMARAALRCRAERSSTAPGAGKARWRVAACTTTAPAAASAAVRARPRGMTAVSGRTRRHPAARSQCVRAANYVASLLRRRRRLGRAVASRVLRGLEESGRRNYRVPVQQRESGVNIIFIGGGVNDRRRCE